jgi:protein-S-isoprenylcysteine O-methyltransferase Ste14
MRPSLRVLGFLLTLAVLRWVQVCAWDREVSFVIILGGPLLVLPIARVGRLMLDAHATRERAAWVAMPVHYAIMISLGSALIEALKRGESWSGWRIPLPPELGWALTVATGIAVLLTVANLALRGLGAPFAIALSRRLATDWMYAWTRNPMVLSLLAFLLSVGLWLRSLGFVLWVLAFVGPVMLAFLKWFEERELEIRFGPSYLDYRARTPMLFPRRPRA